jgi:predicted protein tyrosine phosphatase
VITVSKKILFVCTGNMDRSPTAEDLLKSREDFEAMSAGTWMHAPRSISESLLDWADKIFVMEKEHKAAVLHLKPDVEKKIIVLDIPNNYLRNDPELVRTLRAKLSKHLNIKW